MAAAKPKFFSNFIEETKKTEALIDEVFNIDKKGKTVGLTVDSLKEKAGSKADMAAWMIKLVAQLKDNLSMMKTAIDEVESARNDARSNQKAVIELQQKLLNTDKSSEQQVQVLGNLMEDKLQSTMKKYSDVLRENVPNNAIVLKSIKTAVRQVMKTSDRSKNLVVFGLKESENENLLEKIRDVFEEIDLKPKITAVQRFGKAENDRTRPIRVKFETIESVHDVLKSSKDLRLTNDYKKVFVSIDRSREEQAKHKELVAKLRENILNQPSNHWYIRNKQLQCTNNDSKYTSEQTSCKRKINYHLPLIR